MKRFTLFIFCFLTSDHLFAQLRKVSYDEIAKSKYPISISFQPIFLLNNALKVDVEMQQKEKTGAFIGGLEVYNGKITLLYPQESNLEETNNQDRINGIGLNLAYKLKFQKSEKLTSFYFSPGLTLRNLKLTLKGEGFYAFKQDDVEYYTYGPIEKEYPINSALFYGNLGYHKVWKTTMLLDAYFGFGYKTSTKNNDLKFSRNYDQYAYGFNFNGYSAQAGLKFGFQIK